MFGASQYFDYKNFSQLDLINSFTIFVFLIFFILYFRLKLLESTLLVLHFLFFFIFHPVIITDNIYPDIKYYLVNTESVRFDLHDYKLYHQQRQLTYIYHK